MTIGVKISDQKLQYVTDRVAAKKSALGSSKINKCDCVTVKE